MAHPIVHTEIQVRDAQKAIKWYADVFGWETSYMAEMNYGGFMAGTHGGGFNPTDNLHGTYPYLGTDDIPALLKKAEIAGGKIVAEESPIPGVGHFGLFTDPDGNTLGLFKSDGPSTEAEKKELPNPLVHIEFQVKDVEKAVKWYADMFGWETSYDANMNYGMFKTGDGELAGGFNPITEQPAGVIPYLLVENVDALTAKAKEHGAKEIQAPFDVPTVGRMSLLGDPDGNPLGLIKFAE